MLNNLIEGSTVKKDEISSTGERSDSELVFMNLNQVLIQDHTRLLLVYSEELQFPMSDH